MTRPTPEEAKIMQIRKAVKDFWETDFSRPRDEVKSVYVNRSFAHSLDITILEKTSTFSKSLFEDYLSAAKNKRSEEQRELAERIKTALKYFVMV
jgi:hypothetical protein